MASNGQELPQMEGYATTFDTDAYMKDYYPREYFVNITENRTDLNRAFDHLGFLPVYLQSWLAAFSQDNFIGNDFLEIGVGPNLLASMYASRRFKNIYFSDYSKKVLHGLRQWIDGSPDAWYWTPYYKYVAMMENEQGGAPTIEKRLRAAVKDAFFINVMNEAPLAPSEHKQFDCILASFLFEAISPDHETYARCVKNVSTLLKPGGVILVQGDINANFAILGKEKFFVLDTDSKFVRQAFEQGGFRDVEVFEYEFEEDKRSNGLTDGTGSFYLRAIKA